VVYPRYGELILKYTERRLWGSGAQTVARILELPVAPAVPDLVGPTGGGGRATAAAVISAVTTAPFAELVLDGASQGLVALSLCTTYSSSLHQIR
jgi:hypothetical protein